MMTKNKYITCEIFALVIISIVFIAGCTQKSDITPIPIKDVISEKDSYLNKSVSFEGYVYGISFGVGSPSVPSKYEISVWDVDTTQFSTGDISKTDDLKKYNELRVIIDGDSEIIDGQKILVKGVGVVECPIMDVRAMANPPKYFCIKAATSDVKIFNQTDIQKQKALCRNSLSQRNQPPLDETSCRNLEDSSLEACNVDSDCGLTPYNYPNCVKNGLSEEEHSSQGYNNGRKGTSSCKCDNNVCRFVQPTLSFSRTTPFVNSARYVRLFCDIIKGFV